MRLLNALFFKKGGMAALLRRPLQRDAAASPPPSSVEAAGAAELTPSLERHAASGQRAHFYVDPALSGDALLVALNTLSARKLHKAAHLSEQVPFRGGSLSQGGHDSHRRTPKSTCRCPSPRSRTCSPCRTERLQWRRRRVQVSHRLFCSGRRRAAPLTTRPVTSRAWCRRTPLWRLWKRPSPRCPGWP